MVDDLEVFQASRSGTIAGRSSLLMVTIDILIAIIPIAILYSCHAHTDDEK